MVENIDIGKNNKINNVHEEHLNIKYSISKIYIDFNISNIQMDQIQKS